MRNAVTRGSTLMAKKKVVEPVAAPVAVVPVVAAKIVADKKAVVSKADLIDKIKDKTDMKKKDVESVLNALLEIVKEQVLVEGAEIRLRDFGTFKQKESAPRLGRNPQTGAEIQIKGSKSVAFKTAMKIKDGEEA